MFLVMPCLFLVARRVFLTFLWLYDGSNRLGQAEDWKRCAGINLSPEH